MRQCTTEIKHYKYYICWNCIIYIFKLELINNPVQHIHVSDQLPLPSRSSFISKLCQKPEQFLFFFIQM